MEKIANDILKRIEGKRLIAIDGRCAAGKTTLAALLSEKTGFAVIHADSFFLRPEQRTEERLSTPGGNIDYERLKGEVLQPISRGAPFSYRRFDCKTMSFAESVFVENDKPIIIEGSYSCHPELWDNYDFRIFLTTDPATQLKRIELRNGAERVPDFRDRWIPLEEKYFAAFCIAKRCDLTFYNNS